MYGAEPLARVGLGALCIACLWIARVELQIIGEGQVLEEPLDEGTRLKGQYCAEATDQVVSLQ